MEDKGKRRGGIGRAIHIASLVWMCTLPLVFLLVAPFYGGRAAATAAGLIFGGVLVISLALWVTGLLTPRREGPELTRVMGPSSINDDVEGVRR